MKEPVVCSSNSSFVMDPDVPAYPPQKFVEGCKTDARAVARRRRIEIRRFRIKANSGSFLEPVCKRSRSSLNGFFVVPPAALSSSTRSCEAGTDFSNRLMSTEENVSSTKPMEGQELLNVGHSRSGSEDSVSSSTTNQDAYSRVCSDRSGSDADASRASSSTITTEASTSSESTVTAAEAAQGQQQHPQQQQLVAAAASSSSSSSRSLVCAASDRCPPHGVVFICGRRREMEDAVSVVPSFMSVPCRTVGGCDCSGSPQAMEEDLSTLHFFGVFDGHGGSQVASFCKEHMHRAVLEQLRAVSFGSVNGRPENIEAQVQRAMAASFREMDAQVGGFCYRGDNHSSSSPPSDLSAIAPETVGSTAVVAVVGSNRIIVANCGDSRAVLSRGGQAIPLSQDHKPDRDDELARVEAAGGRVIFWNGHRVLGVLAMSRAIGDRYLKPYIIAEPDVTCTERTEEDECLILASDGLWDVLSNELVCEIARKCLAGRHRNQGQGEDGEESAADMAAALLAKVAFAKGSSDNISVVVVDLRPRRR